MPRSLPEGVETITVGQDALRRPVVGGGAFAEDYVRVSDLPKIEQAVEERVREALLGDEAVQQAVAEHSSARKQSIPSSALWVRYALVAALDAALKPNSAEEAEQS